MFFNVATTFTLALVASSNVGVLGSRDLQVKLVDNSGISKVSGTSSTNSPVLKSCKLHCAPTCSIRQQLLSMYSDCQVDVLLCMNESPLVGLLVVSFYARHT